MISAPRAARLKTLLDPLVISTAPERARAIARDPVELPRRYGTPADREVAGLLAAALAYGRADVFKPKLLALLAELGPSPAAFVRAFDPRRDGARFAGFAYRFHLPGDLGALLCGTGATLRDHGSLGARFAALLSREGTLQGALGAFARELRTRGAALAGDAMGPARALDHLLPDASRGAACKRLVLYLRWMVRRDEVDVGAWEGVVSRSALVVPLDTHVSRISRLLGLTRRKDLSWRTAEEITASLRRLDPEDPVRYDFALCHLGMSGACPARRRPENCRACPLAAECTAGRTALRRGIP
jgi:uncharacterized protein (TIGR02757 family)